MSYERESRPRPRHRAGFFEIAAGMSLLVLIVSLAFPAISQAVDAHTPNDVHVDLQVITPYGGVFNEDCTLKQDGANFLNAKVVARNLETPRVGSQTRYYSEDSFVRSEDQNCNTVLTYSLAKDRTMGLYNGDKRVGILTIKDIKEKYAVASVEVRVYREVDVVFTLQEKFDRCEGTDDDWLCWDGSYFGLKLNSKTGGCSGQNFYDDIKTGTKIYAEGLSGSVVASTKLKQEGDYTLESVKSKLVNCTFKASFKNLPNDDEGYKFTTVGRGGPEYTIESLRDLGWQAALILKAY